jgi:hypothetical protein
MKKLILYTLVLFSYSSTAQKTPADLGEFIYKSLRAENLKALNTYIATPDEVYIFSKKLGRSYTTQEAEDYKKEQALTDSAFLRKAQFIIDDGKQRSIVWAKTELVEVKLQIETYILSSLDESKTIDFGYIEVIFSYDKKLYALTMETAFDAIGRWRLTGDKITLESYTE